jgi:signal peptide peptidase SppA
MKVEKYNCECIECGHKVTSEKHCDELKCPKCGGQMRRVERPGPGKGESANEGALLARFATRIVNTPLMIAPDKLNVIINVLGSRIGLETNGNTAEIGLSSRKAKKDESGIAIIPVHDTLVHRASGISAMSGLTTYEQIGASFQAALKDPKVSKIVLDIDSPGGEVSGVFDLVDEIYNARGIKPIIAAVNDIAYSAAYAIASAADKIYVPRTGGTGSIGVIAVHTDQSKYNEKAGMKYTAIYAGAKKNDFSPHEEISVEALGDVQSKVDSVYDLFVKTVARNRNINPDDVKATEAGIFLGEEGLEVGLADQILSWNQIMETITTNKGGANMGFKEKLDALLADASDEEVTEAFKSLGYVSKEDLPDVEAIKTEAKVEALKEYTEQHAGDEGATQEVADLRKEVEVLRGEVAESKKETETEKDARRKLELTQEIKDIGVVGDVEENVNILFSVEKMNPELAKKMMDQLKKNGEALSASGFFGELGSSGHGSSKESATAFDELKAKAEALIKEGVEPPKAWTRAARENPELYKSYLEGRA